MKCVPSIKYAVKCNGTLTKTIIPERGLRQGDPLSPYIFLFCMEAFSRMLIRAQHGGLIRGIRDSINGLSINHLFFVDDVLLFFLSCSGLDDRLISGNFEPCIDWLEASMRLLDKKALEDFIIFLWNSWNSRNNFTFRGKVEGASVIRDKAFALSNDFRVHNLSHKPIIQFHLPGQGGRGERMGYGVIARDEVGFMVGGCRGCKNMEVTSERAELVALDEGMQLAGRLNIQQVLFESDNASLINRIKRRGMDITIMGKYEHETCRKLEMFASADVK
ncbi:hypothetical protein Goshw_023480 [Gossypium schwendimanii]|uniref:Reverse transcriptase domain-containing protein n=1 Tax=Gossypium schwendimanii TaxID=34291 RepID=A0A7J9M8F5_GOSSC|nr:hypothetical protein [Gossypium schwendimanii]